MSNRVAANDPKGVIVAVTGVVIARGVLARVTRDQDVAVAVAEVVAEVAVEADARATLSPICNKSLASAYGLKRPPCPKWQGRPFFVRAIG